MTANNRPIVKWLFVCCLSVVCQTTTANSVWAAEEGAAVDAPPLDLRELVQAGGIIGAVIVALSVAMVALIVEHLLSIRRRALMPSGLAEEAHKLIVSGEIQEAEQLCRQRPSFLAHVLSAGLAEVRMGYSAVEKAMEDASLEHSARLLRKIEYLSVIGTIAPMLGLLGTVWGMILAFLEFELKANPQVAQLAPGIYKALVTTLLGLGVAVPALASFAIFRNRIDELVAESSRMAEHVFADYKRSRAKRKRRKARRGEQLESPPTEPLAPRVPSVTLRGEQTG